MDGGDGLGLVGRPVELGHAHAAEPFGRDLEALAAQLAFLHEAPSVGAADAVGRRRLRGWSRPRIPAPPEPVTAPRGGRQTVGDGAGLGEPPACSGAALGVALGAGEGVDAVAGARRRRGWASGSATPWAWPWAGARRPGGCRWATVKEWPTARRRRSATATATATPSRRGRRRRMWRAARSARTGVDAGRRRGRDVVAARRGCGATRGDPRGPHRQMGAARHVAHAGGHGGGGGEHGDELDGRRVGDRRAHAGAGDSDRRGVAGAEAGVAQEVGQRVQGERRRCRGREQRLGQRDQRQHEAGSDPGRHGAGFDAGDVGKARAERVAGAGQQHLGRARRDVERGGELGGGEAVDVFEQQGGLLAGRHASRACARKGRRARIARTGRPRRAARGSGRSDLSSAGRRRAAVRRWS